MRSFRKQQGDRGDDDDDDDDDGDDGDVTDTVAYVYQECSKLCNGGRFSIYALPRLGATRARVAYLFLACDHNFFVVGRFLRGLE